MSGREGLRALVIDDEPLAREGLTTLLAEDVDVTSVEEAADVEQAVERIRAGHPHIVFLDIEMPRGNGFSVLSGMGSMEIPALVFVTAHEQYAVRAFENNAVDYLLKPVTARRFAVALNRAKLRARAALSGEPSRGDAPLEAPTPSAERYPDRLAVKSAERVKLVGVRDIQWIEAAENYVNVHLKTKGYLLHGTMNEVVGVLDPKLFLRVHRSAVVNLQAIEEVHAVTHGEYLLVLQNGSRVRTSRRYSAAVRSLISNPF